MFVLNICDPCIYHQLRRAGTPTTRLVRSTPATSPTQPMVRNARRGLSTTRTKNPRHTNLTACTPPTTTARRQPATTAASSAKAMIPSGAPRARISSIRLVIVTYPGVTSCLVSASLKLESTALINVPDNCVHPHNETVSTSLIISHRRKQMFCSTAFEY